jgi:hypothetical protein
MINSLRIAEPCHQQWNKMLPDEKGRYCLSCSKSVIDFTGWEPEAIANYLMSNKSASICGRLHAHHLGSEQIDKPQLLRRVITSTWRVTKKVAAVIIIIFGMQITACKSPATTGKVKVEDTPTITEVILGEIAVMDTACLKEETAVFLGGITLDSGKAEKEY